MGTTSNTGKTLSELIGGIPCTWNGRGSLAARVNRIQCDSRLVECGDLFVAIPGTEADGHHFLPEALKRGAQAIVSVRTDRLANDLSIPLFRVMNARNAYAKLAACYYGHPAQKIKLIGVTGTNGKTTTALLIQHLLNSYTRSGYLGTICYDDGRHRQPASQTTPDANVLNLYLNRMVENGLSYCVMEVSSHALDQDRTYGFDFAGAVFTNLSQDHLDYHQDLSRYYQVKKKLFASEPQPACCVVNRDDAYGIQLMRELDGRRLKSFSLKHPADYIARNVQDMKNGIHFSIGAGQKWHEAFVPLRLFFNASNALASLAAVSEEGRKIEDLLAPLATFPGVPGRMERIDEGQDFDVFVDYAHTPDALLNVLSVVRGTSGGKLISVFGCGGDRDKTKRAMMGKIACAFSDVVIVTSDNSRSEDPQQIMEEIKRGTEQSVHQAQLSFVVDRSKAIGQAIRHAGARDVVCICGKGHENYQLIGDRKMDFSDREQAQYWIKKLCFPSKKYHKFAREA